MIPIGRIEGISHEHKAQPWTVGIPSWELFLEIPIRGFPSSCRAQSWLLLCSFLFPGVGTGSCSVHSFFRVSRLSSSPTPHPIHPSRDEKTQNVSTPPIFLRPMWEFSQGSEFIGKFRGSCLASETVQHFHSGPHGGFAFPRGSQAHPSGGLKPGRSAVTEEKPGKMAEDDPKPF